MRIAPIALLVLAELGGSAAAGRPVLAITKSPDLPAGFAATVTTDVTMDEQLMFDGAPSPFVATRHTSYLVEALDIDGDHLAKARVTYQPVVDTGDMTVLGADPRSAMTYVVASGTSAMDVVHGDASPVSSEELAPVVDELRPRFERSPIRALLLGRTFKVGKRVTLGDDVVTELFGADRFYMTYRSFSIALRSVKRGVAVFDLTCELIRSAAGGDIVIAGTGALRIDTRRVLPLSAAFDATLSGMGASGTLAISRTFSY